MTFAPLTGDRGAAVLMSFLGAFPAKTSALQGKAPELTENGRDYGGKWREYLAKYDHGSHSWKTAQPLLLEGWGECSVIWPRWGMMRGGVCWELATLARPTSETAYGLWPTPTVCENYNRKGASKTSGDGLATAIKKWPTPTAHNAKEGAFPAEYNRNTPTLAAQAGGQLSPTWVEWLMGWPLGWTGFEPLEMAKFQAWRRSLGDC
jgi:hypothetical protein